MLRLFQFSFPSPSGACLFSTGKCWVFCWVLSYCEGDKPAFRRVFQARFWSRNQGTMEPAGGFSDRQEAVVTGRPKGSSAREFLFFLLQTALVGLHISVQNSYRIECL